MQKTGRTGACCVCYASLLILLFLTSTATAADGLVKNGDFERAPDARAMKGTVIQGQQSLPEWTTNGCVEYIESGHRQRDMLVVVPEGVHAVRLGNEASISQRIAVRRGGYYSVVFTAGRTCAQEERLNVSVATDSDIIPIQTVYSSTGWDSYAWAFRAMAGSVVFRLHNPGVEEDPACGPVIDSVGIKQLFPPRYVPRNWVKNGDFEEGPLFLPATNAGVLLPPLDEDDVAPLPGWIIESLKAVKYVDAEHFFVPRGRRAVEFVAGRESVLSQVVRTVPGKVYTLSFLVGDSRDGCVGYMTVEAFAARETVKAGYSSKGRGGAVPAKLTFKAMAARTRMTFYSSFYHMKSDGSMCGPLIDDVRLF